MNSWRSSRNLYVSSMIDTCSANSLQVEAWTTTHALLQSPDVPVEAKLFAATTLKGKVRAYRSSDARAG